MKLSRRSELPRNPVLDLYNKWQEDERDGVDYLFDIHCVEDWLTLIDSGISVMDLFAAHWEANHTNKRYFLYGTNYPKITFVNSAQIQNLLYDFVVESFDNFNA